MSQINVPFELYGIVVGSWVLWIKTNIQLCFV